MPSTRSVVRNARLVLQSVAQHLVDDPALLAVQVSRRLPFRTRVRAGEVLLAVAGRLPNGGGAAALGAFMAGDDAAARSQIARSTGSRLGGEVAILLQRSDLLSTSSSPVTLARAAWAAGELSRAVDILQQAGRGESRYARRIRSELRLLGRGHRLSISEKGERPASPAPDEQLRVLHVLTNSLPHTQSGYSLRTHRILTALAQRGIGSAALTRTGYPVMIGVPLAADEDEVDGIRYVRTLPSRLPQTQEERLEAEVARALELVEELRPHVIHATTNYYNALVARAVSEATGIPWILEVRGLMEQTWTASLRTEEQRAAARGSEKVRLIAARESELASDAAAVVTLSRTMREVLVERGVPERAITVMPNGVEDGLLERRQSTAEARAELGLGMQGAFVIGTVSALVEYEGLDVLLRAVARLLSRETTPSELRDRLHVVIAGDGTAAPGLRVLAESLGIGERVHMPGRVPRETAPVWVQALDVVAVPRLDVEVARTVTPQKPVEAMALGRPVILSDLPALVETVTGGDGAPCAITHPAGSDEALADAIISLADDPRRAASLVERGREIAAERTWTALVERYTGLYTAVRTEQEGPRG